MADESRIVIGPDGTVLAATGDLPAGLVPAVVQLDSDKIAWAVTTLVGNVLPYVQAGRQRAHGGTIGVRAVFDAAESLGTVEVTSRTRGGDQGTTVRLTFPHVA